MSSGLRSVRPVYYRLSALLSMAKPAGWPHGLPEFETRPTRGASFSRIGKGARLSYPQLSLSAGLGRYVTQGYADAGFWANASLTR